MLLLLDRHLETPQVRKADMASRQFAGVLILARLCATQLQARVNPVGDVIEALGGQCYFFCGDFGADLTPLDTCC